VQVIVMEEHFVPDVLIVAGFPSIADVPDLAGVPSVAGILAVASVF